jgi:hypothetical protein
MDKTAAKEQKMKHKMITAEIRLGDDRYTIVNGKTIEEIIEKIYEYHSFSDFLKQHFTKKGTLSKEVKSGWYFKNTIK